LECSRFQEVSIRRYSSEPVFGAYRNQVRIEVEAALVDFVVVVVQANAQVVAEVVTETGTGVVLVAGGVDVDGRSALVQQEVAL